MKVREELKIKAKEADEKTQLAAKVEEARRKTANEAAAAVQAYSRALALTSTLLVEPQHPCRSLQYTALLSTYVILDEVTSTLWLLYSVS